jgi:hypothetical protein
MSILSVHDINYWAVLVAVVVNMAVGAVWYSPNVFGKTWSKLLGKKMEDMKANGSTGYMVSTVGAVLQSFILANLIRDMGITTAMRGALLGALVWIAFVAAATAPDTVFSGRPWKLWKINTGYFLVVLLINGALLSVWH